MFDEKFKRNVLIDFSDVGSPPVDLLLRDKASAALGAVGQTELDPFQRDLAGFLTLRRVLVTTALTQSGAVRS
jgi:hypothetical protein